ncbi:hypothetical protein Tco_1532695 [Tanacetum coccineum]
MSQPANDEFYQHLSDDEASNHEDASDTGAAPKQQQQVIPQTTIISNIKLPILKKEEYDIWAMEMEHYLEYIDNEVWKVIQNGNSKKRISTGKDGVVRILPPVTAAEIQAVEKERKAKNILLMAIPKEHMRRFHGMDDAKEIWEAIRTRFGGNANSKKMQKAVFKQQFEAFTISSSEGLEKGYDRFQQLLSQLEAHGAEVSTEDANHKFLRSLPPAWSNLAMTMRTKPDVDTLSIDDLYNNLRVFEQEIQGASKTSSSAQNVAFVSQSKSSTNKVKSGFTGAYSTCTPSTSSTNIPEKEALAGFADEVIYSLFAKQSEDWDLLHEDLEQIDDLDIEEMDINWQIAMIAIRMKKFYKKTGRRVRVDGKTPVGFDKKKLECFNCHNTGHFAREITSTKVDQIDDEVLENTNSIPPGIEYLCFNAESDLLESLLHLRSSINGILQDRFSRWSRWLYDTTLLPASGRIEILKIYRVFLPSPIPVKDSDSLMEEIDIFLDGDKSIPPGIESDDFDSEDDNNSTFLPENKIYDPGICIEVESTKILAPLSPVIDTLLTFSSKNEDKVFNHGVLASKEKSPSFPSHRGLKASKLFHRKPDVDFWRQHSKFGIARIVKALVFSVLSIDHRASNSDLLGIRYLINH